MTAASALLTRLVVLCAIGASLVACTGDPRSATVRETPRASRSATTTTQDPRPNVVLVVTDDQRHDSLWAMPNVRRVIAGHGVGFRRAFVSNPECCPSRVTLLTGGYSHTTGIYTNAGPYGGAQAFQRSGGERQTIAVALQASGYRTALFGKYLNGYRGDRVPPGWDEWSAFVAAGVGGAYYDYDMYTNVGARRPRITTYGSHPRDYSTTVIRRLVTRFIRTTPQDVPFFLVVAPFAAHGPWTPAPEDVGTYAEHREPLVPSVNEVDVSDKPTYIRDQPPIDTSLMQEKYRSTYESLMSVDRMVRALATVLRSTGRLRETLVIFTSDHGTAFGEHRWTYKLVPYDEVIRVPLLLRYDALIPPPARGATSRSLVANVDIAPTIADATGLSSFDGVGHVDGRSMLELLDDRTARIRDSVLLEHVGGRSDAFIVPTYCGLRTDRFLYVRYATGEQELYAMQRDPYQMRNVAASRPDIARRLRHRVRVQCRPHPPGGTWWRATQ